MSDHEMRKLEELLNCKNRAINKWIQEKEDEFDELTQKIYKQGKKLIEGKTLTEEIDEQIRLEQKLEKGKLVKDNNSKRSSIRITETESEDGMLKSQFSDSQTGETSLLEHIEKEIVSNPL